MKQRSVINLLNSFIISFEFRPSDSFSSYFPIKFNYYNQDLNQTKNNLNSLLHKSGQMSETLHTWPLLIVEVKQSFT